MDRLSGAFVFTMMTIGIGFLIALVTRDAFFCDVFGGLAVSLGTLLLAYYTAVLGRDTVEEGRKARRLQRIKDQLDGLYGPLMAYIAQFGEQHVPLHEAFHTSMKQIRIRYEYLATPEFAKQLREYFPAYDRDLRTPDTMDWGKFIKPKIDQLKKDHESLLKDYESLTQSQISKEESD